MRYLKGVEGHRPKTFFFFIMKPKELKKYLKSEGFELLRETGKHRIYVHTRTRKQLSTSKTPSDGYAWRQIMRDIKRYQLAG
jgi:predicted RNA binding protein YcfA (HicA-like mRNA interferase family)